MVKVEYTFGACGPARVRPLAEESEKVWILREDVWYRPFDQKEDEPPPGSARTQRFADVSAGAI
jgi:hypothetical protein